MTDQEVNEYMHRFLDDDLSEDEAELLLEHLKQSPVSEAMFNRLVQLNDDLQQLPKVTPPISIVDAIIPQLEREGLWDQPIAAAGGQELHENWAGMDEPGRRNIRKRTRDMMKWIGGVAVAGLALTVFATTIFNGTNSNQSADEASLMRVNNNSAMSTSAADISESSGFVVMDQSGADMVSELEAEEPMEIMDSGSAAMEDDGGFSFDSSAIGLEGLNQADTAAPKSSEQRSVSVSVTSKSQNNSPAPSTPSPKEATEAGAGASEGASAGGGVSGTEGGLADQPKSDEPMESQIQSVPDEPALTEEQHDDQTKLQGESQPDTEAADANDADIFVIEESNPNAFVSVDKASIATATAVTGGTQIVVTNRDGHVLYRSGVYAGEMTSLVWFADSKQLMLELSLDGSEKQVRIDVANQTDTVLSE